MELQNFLIIVALLLLSCENRIHAEKLLTCTYVQQSWFYWPTHTHCRVYQTNLSINNRNEKFKFTGTPQEKTIAKTLYMIGTLTIEFLPVDMFTEFPNLDGLIIHSPDWPVVKSGIFTKEFIRLQYLYLDQSKIKLIEENAFKELTELKWVAIGGNQIDYLKKETFQHNLKLEFVGFSDNNLKMISPNFFDNLKNLFEINFGNNSCVDKMYHFSHASWADVKLDMQKCFTNCELNYNCNPPLDDFMIYTEEKLSEISSMISYLKRTNENLSLEIKELKGKCVAKDEFFHQITSLNSEIEKLKVRKADKLSDETMSTVLEKLCSIQEKYEKAVSENFGLIKKNIVLTEENSKLQSQLSEKCNSNLEIDERNAN